jgi:hypothetical protein
MEEKMRSVLLATAALSLIVTSALADETLKYRTVYHITSFQSQPIPDADGHLMGIVHAAGIASFADGNVAVDNFTTFTDYTKGSGPIVLSYGDLTFSDGSVLFTKSSGATITEGTQSTFKGTITVIGGKGRFAGAKGDGTFAGERFQPQPGAGAQLYNDFIINVRK